MAMEDNAAIPVSLIDIHPLSEMKMDRGSEIDTPNKNYGSKYGAWKLSALLWPLRDIQSGFIPMLALLLPALCGSCDVAENGEHIIIRTV
jgi:hypothetical protein